ncbi:hypothetical protein GCM10029964_110090 [Kibdelosporangium lantanae]
MLVSTKVVGVWEDAYRRYGRASDIVARSRGRDVAAVQELITASRAVATAWRAIAAQAELPWWVVAAVESAAEAFAEQARQEEAALQPVAPVAQDGAIGGRW